MINPMLFLLLILKFADSYKDGTWVVVVEYQSVPDNNLEEYLRIVHEVTAKYDVGAIIFPEGTLDRAQTKSDIKNQSVFIENGQNPCLNPTSVPQLLQKLSCAARYHHTAIVLNLIEEYDYEQYSSDVAIDSRGTIVFSIRREHRLGVSALNSIPIPFAVPARYRFIVEANLPPDLKVPLKFTPTSILTGFSFSWEKIIAQDKRIYVVCSNWISQLPFLTSLQVYQMWAEEFNLLLFVSGANDPKKGQGGTAIFHGSAGPILSEIEASGGTKIFFYNIASSSVLSVPQRPFDEEAKSMDQFYLEQDPDLDRYKSEVLDPREPKKRVKLCYDKTNDNFFCCNFFYNISIDSSVSKPQYTYHLVAYRGYKTYYDIFEPGGVEVCAIIACLNTHLSSCGQRFKYDDVGWSVTFENIVITATFGPPVKEKIYYSSQFPNSLLGTVKPIHPNFTSWRSALILEGEETIGVERTFELTKRQNRILTFGIFGRNFTLYDPRSTGSKMGGKFKILYLAVGLSVLRV